MRRCWYVWGSLILPIVVGPMVAAAAEKARPADAFVDSMGVCTHWSYPDTPYGPRYAELKSRLTECGIRHVRDGFNTRLSDLALAGIRTTVVAEPDVGTPAQIRDKIKTANLVRRSIEAVEGPNEPDLFWPRFNRTYQGKGFPDGVVAFQKDLYAILKADPATRDLAVIGPSLGVTYGYDTKSPFGKGTLTGAVDFGCFHPYPGGNPFSNRFAYGQLAWFYAHGNFPACNIDEYPYAFDIYAPPFEPKPMVATETGYATHSQGTSEAAHGKYIPRIYCEYFRKGIARTFVYELVNEWNRPDDEQANYGLLRHDLTPKPAFTAVKNLIGLLREPAAKPFEPGSLDFELHVRPAGGYDRLQYVHRLLLQKSTGEFYLLLWHEVPCEDASVKPHKQLSVPVLPATLSFPRGLARADVYLPNQGAQPVRTLTNVKAVEIEIPDQVVVLKLQPAKQTDAQGLYGIHFWGYPGGATIDPVPANLLDAPQYGGWDVEVVLTHSPDQWWQPGFFSGLYADLFLNKKVSLITRIDYRWGQCIPAPGNPDSVDWPVAVVNTINTLRHGCRLWVLGNEPNLQGEGTGWPDNRITPAGYAAMYRAVRRRVHTAAQESAAGPHLLLIAPPSPGGVIPGVRWMDGNQWLREVIDAVPAEEIDGFAIHAYGFNVGEFHNSYVSQLAVIDSRKLYDRPVYMTEWNRPTDPANPADEANTAQFCREAFADVDAWNSGNGHHNIVALCWFVYDADNQAGGGWNNYAIEYWKDCGHPAGDSRDLFTAFQQAVDLRYPAGLAGTRGPILARTPAEFAHTIHQGQALPADVLAVQNIGTGLLGYTLSDDAAWLTLDPPAGAVAGEPGAVSLNYAVADLAPGTYRATIMLAAAGALESPQAVDVRLTVQQRPVPGDLNGDRHVDSADVGLFRACMTGPEGTVTDACLLADLDGDRDVDQSDFGRLQRCLTGPLAFGNPDC